METNFYEVFKNISYETIVIGFAVFVLTMFIKWPIKKLTSKFAEEKRKAINSCIILIPILLSGLITVAYYAITKHTWFSLNQVETMFGAWVSSVAFYAIYSRGLIIIKGILTGKANSEISKLAVKKVKEIIKTLSENLKTDTSYLGELTKKINSLMQLKLNVENNQEQPNLEMLFKTNIEIQNLTQQSKQLTKQIENTKNELHNYTTQLSSMKGELK